MFFKAMSISLNIEDEWKTSRAGARAGSGFRYQDSATLLALIRCWRGEIHANSATPESLDDFSLEACNTNVWVQVKSKVNPRTQFRPREIADIVLSDVGESGDQRVIVIDRPFLGYENDEWSSKVLDEPSLVDSLTGAMNGDSSRIEKLRDRLSKTTLITSPSPIAEVVPLISEKCGVGEGASSICARSLLHQIGLSSSENARRSYKSRQSVTIGDVDRIIFGVLDLVDQETVEQAFHKGLVQFIDFHQPIEDEHFYEGVAARPGHVAAGLVQPRDEDVSSVIEPLLSGRHVLVAGPSGAGKSALCYLAAFDTRHVFRWLEVISVNDLERPMFLRALRAQMPTTERPVVIYIDDVGRGSRTVWAWLVEQARNIPGLQVVGSVREEDVNILTAIDQVTVVRPKLSRLLAQQIWERLSEREATKTAYWKEAYELSNGLMLEYVHILTQGNRLREVVFEQIRQRVEEKRSDELAILPLAAAAGMYGARVVKSLLLNFLNINQGEFSTAFLRLRNEHLIGSEKDGFIGGLHELRSREIYNACRELMILDGIELVRDAYYCIPSVDVRRYATRSARDGVLNTDNLISISAKRINGQPDINVLTSVLEALRLITYENDGEVFKRIADKYNLSHNEYMLAMMFLNPGMVESLADASPVFSHLGAMANEFQAERALDRREEFLDKVSVASMSEAIKTLDIPETVLGVLTALHGIRVSQLLPTLLETTTKVMNNAPHEDIAEYLAILEESDVESVSQAVELLGGSENLIDGLWRKTPWAIKPVFESLDDGVTEIRADLLAVTGELLSEPDSVVFNYADLIGKLCPNATHVTSHPVHFSGQVLEINGWTPGLKRINRNSIHSRASVAWNRMLIYAVAQRNCSSSRTEVLERHKYGINQAASQFVRMTDNFCRGQPVKKKHMHEAKALEIIVDIMPPLPLGTPEDELDNPLSGELDDSIGRLISHVAGAIQKVGKGDMTGLQMTLEMEPIEREVGIVAANEDWGYIGGAPCEDLDNIRYVSGSLRRIGLAIGKKKISRSSLVLPSSRKWGQGKGLDRALQNLDRQWKLRWGEIRKNVEKEFGVSAFARPMKEKHGVHWPDCETCLVIECGSLIDYFAWLDKAHDELRVFAETCLSVVVVPKVKDLLVHQMAMRVFSFSLLPDDEFEENWRSHLNDENWFTSDTIKNVKIVQDSMISLYATQHHLRGRDLLDEEMSQLQTWKESAEKAFSSISNSAADESNEGAVAAEGFLNEFHSMLVENGDGSGAVSFASLQQNALMNGDESEQVTDLASLIVYILQSDLGLSDFEE